MCDSNDARARSGSITSGVVGRMTEPVEHGAADGGGAVGGAGSSITATRPLVLPETFDGSGNWDE